MEDLLEMRLHGRGGQGAKSAAQILAEAVMESGKYIQAFPEYGPERAGAPIQAFVRVHDRPIRLHCGVQTPDVVLVIDPSLMESVDVTEGLHDGYLIVNIDKDAKSLKEELNIENCTVATVNATEIALDTVKRPMPNLPMLGALIKVNPLVSLDDVKAQIKKKFEKKIGTEMTEANLRALERAYEEVDVV